MTTRLLVICQNARESALLGRAYFHLYPEDGVRGRLSPGPVYGREVIFVPAGSSIIGRRVQRVMEFNLRPWEWHSSVEHTSVMRWLREDVQCRLTPEGCGLSRPTYTLSAIGNEDFEEGAKFVRRYVLHPWLEA